MLILFTYGTEIDNIFSEEEKTNIDGTQKNLNVSLQGIMHKNNTKDDIFNKFEKSGNDF